MNHLSSFSKSEKSHRILTAFLLSLFTLTLYLSGCTGLTSSQDANAAFSAFTRQLFRTEVSSSTISLHYTLQNPSGYGIKNTPITYGSFNTDPSAALASVENCNAALHRFESSPLSDENRLTYDVIDSYLKNAASGANYLLYQEPLSPISGIHAQLPVLLSEYQFYNKEDVTTYLELLAQTGTYFDSLISFEQAKSRAGLFMPDYQVDSITAQCTSFVDMHDQNYLYTTFSDRLNALNTLSRNEKVSFISQNKELIETVIFPAYTHLAEELEHLKNSSKNENGLCFFPEGKSYYEYLVRQCTGISDPIPTLQKMTKLQILDDLNAIEKILLPTAQTSAENTILERTPPTSMLNDLKTKMADAFPEPPSVNYCIKYVPSAMEAYLSPAFYMIPTIDNISENVIYINKGQTASGLNLYTTLAHEGYPGHLYQTVYFSAKKPDPIRNLLDFGGYVEGWATYAEMMSYYMAPLSRIEATLLQKNSSTLLGLYALADMGIHYDGWSLNAAAAFFKDYGITDIQVVKSIYELIVGNPGNYLKYYLGYLEILNLKKEIASQLKTDFSQKNFHKAVLDVGPAPFEIVKKQVCETLLKK